MKRKDSIIAAIIAGMALAIVFGLIYSNHRKDIETAQTETTEAESKGEAEDVIWVDYPTDNWSVKYPSDWVADAGSATDIITFEEPLRGTDDDFREYFSVCYLGTTEELGTLDDYVNNTLVPAIERDPSCLTHNPVEELRLETEESVNKVYANVRQIKLRCKMMGIDYQNAYKSYSGDEAETETVKAEEVNADVREETDSIPTEVAEEAEEEAEEAEALELEVVEDNDVEPQEEELPDSDSAVEALEANGATLYRTYTIIENDGYIYAFISAVSDTNVEDYTETFETALGSLNCLLGESEILDVEYAKNLTKVDVPIEDSTTDIDATEDTENVEDVEVAEEVTEEDIESEDKR